MTATVRDLERRRAKLRADLKALDKRVAKRKAQKRVRCNHCGRLSTIGLTTYIQTYFYVQPYSCTGGDYWSEGEGRFRCDKCDYENRLIYRPEIEALEPYFKSVEKRHGDPPGLKWCN